MTTPGPSVQSTKHLVERFTAIALDQDQAALDLDTSRYNQLFGVMEAIVAELRSRSGDHRRALVALYDHKNVQVRLAAAKATLALEPQAARRVLERISELKHLPQGLDAGMCLRRFDSGQFKPT